MRLIRESVEIIFSGHTIGQKINYLKYLFSGKGEVLSYDPITISIVGTTRCTLSCDMCPTHSGRVPEDYPHKQKNVKDIDFEMFKDDLKEQGQKVESYEKKLPVEQEIPALLENLSDMAKDSNIKIVSIVPAMPKDNNPGNKSLIYREIPILITAKSGYHELGHFLNSLENADRFMKVVDINIKANKASPKKHDVELMICTYVLLPENK